MGKIPVVVPRQKSFDEHVNNHQVEFVKAVAQRMGTIIPVYDIEELKAVFLNYEELKKAIPAATQSNNAQFNKKLEEVVENLFQAI